jgi:hypothetical protein
MADQYRLPDARAVKHCRQRIGVISALARSTVSIGLSP